ncbi:hypothetical protein TYRP_009798 [Tyrophagus putrescentiae]|nr:hypothetical protein TYRP_009798 [Tyrophagus putrescentiae]
MSKGQGTSCIQPQTWNTVEECMKKKSTMVTTTRLEMATERPTKTVAARKAAGNCAMEPEADEILAILEEATAAPEAKVAGAATGGRIAEPLRLHEDHHVDDGEAEAEDRPEDADGLAVAGVHVAGAVVQWIVQRIVAAAR